MKKNPGRRERRRLHFGTRRQYGEFRAKVNEFNMKLAAKKRPAAIKRAVAAKEARKKQEKENTK